MSIGRWFDVARLRVAALFGGTKLDAQLNDELRLHLEYQIAEHEARGMTPAEARRAALSTFGGVDNIREQARDARGVGMIEHVLRDARYTLRALLREPMLLIAATLSIALGAAGNIAVVTLARALIFAAPDVRDPATLVNIQVSHGSHASVPRWLALEASGVLEHVAGFSIEKHVNWVDNGVATSITPMVVTANFFDVTGVPVALGRPFTAAEARAELDPHVAVISHELWQRELRADSSVLGRRLTINGETYTVLGVLPPRLRSVAAMGIAPNIYLPVNRSLVPEWRDERTNIVQLLGRLAPHQSLSDGRVRLDALDKRLARQQGDSLYGGVQVFAPVGTLASQKQLRVVGSFMALLGLVSLLVVLIGCANVAGLLIARGTRRRQEIAVRLAIGGSRGRLIQQLLIEGLWIAAIGTAAGATIAIALMRVVNASALPIPLPLALHLEPDLAVVSWAVALVVISVIASALFPALQVTRVTLTAALKREEPRRVMRRVNARAVLMTGQVMVSTVLLVTALLFVRNLRQAQITDPGFETHRALVAQIGFVRGGATEANAAFLELAADRLRGMPGIEAATYSAHLPLTATSGSSNGLTARISGGEPRHVEFVRTVIGPGFFATLGIPLVAGRDFERTDASGTTPVAIINQQFVQQYFDGKSPIGQRLKFSEDSAELTVVGVVEDIKQRTLGEDARGAIFLPVRQRVGDVHIGFVVARTASSPTPLLRPAREAIGALDRSMAVSVDPMETVLQFALLPSRIGASVLGTLGLLGLLLAAFGLYAIVAFNVTRRTSEIAIRSALGASRRAILVLVVRDASLQVGIGLVLGLAVSAVVTAPLTTFLAAGLSATDPLSFAGTAAVFLIVALIASGLPARAATRVSPAIAMRLE